MTLITEEQIARALDFGPATVHEAAGRLGALPSAIKPVNPLFRLAGRAFPVHGPAGDNLWIHRAIYAAEPGDVLVVSVSGGAEWGYWGEILNEAAMARGLAGLVIDGGVRDVAVLANQPFPVFSNGICLRGTGKDFGAIGWLGAPIRLGDVIIAAGDLVVGDVDGVVVISKEMAGDVLDQSEKRLANEAEKIRQLREGARSIDLYGFGEGEAAKWDYGGAVAKHEDSLP